MSDMMFWILIGAVLLMLVFVLVLIFKVSGTERRLELEIKDNKQETVNMVSTQLRDMSMQNEQKLENIRQTMQGQLGEISRDNSAKLEDMRKTVDEKLEDRLNKSFSVVSERLEQVYRGLGEMQSLASGVGDLKKVLSNVKTRGILGEIQLGAILGEILSPEQYDENVATKPGSSDRVEFAIRMPGSGDGIVYLPIDAKFPGDLYGALMDAYDTADAAAVEAASKALVTRFKQEAKDIHDKYVAPPYTTDFAIMFLPTEGLYAEAVRMGMVEILQREYKVNIAGPTTMAALLNSLQMGFRTLAIEQHSSEVWELLGAVKTEFEKFGEGLDKAQNHMRQASEDLETLVGTRTNVIKRKLKSVEALDEISARNLLDD